MTSAIPDVALDTTYLPGLTLHDALSHQSGLLDYIVISGDASDSALSQMLTSTTWRTTDYFMDPPATFWNYANPNFYLAGLAVERADGVPYRQSVQKRVLAPLGMTRTFFLPSDVKADGDFSNGASTNTDGTPWDVAPDSYDNGWARPAGYAFSSVLDYARFVQFLDAGDATVLPDAQRQEMETAQVSLLSAGPYDGYGYGIFRDDGFVIGKDWYQPTLLLHGGDIPGFASDFYLIPSTGFGMVSFANADGAHFQASVALAFQTFGGLPAPTTLPAQLQPDPTTFPALAGTYYEPHQVVGHMVIGVDASNNLTVSLPDVDPITPPIPYDKTMTPIAPNDFVWKVQGTEVEVTFVPDSTGAFTWVRTRYFAAQRATTPSPPPKPLATAPVRIDPAALRARLHAPRL